MSCCPDRDFIIESLEKYVANRELIAKKNMESRQSWLSCTEASWRCFVAAELLTSISITRLNDPEDDLYYARIKYRLWAKTAKNTRNKYLFKIALEELSNIEENIFTIE